MVSDIHIAVRPQRRYSAPAEAKSRDRQFRRQPRRHLDDEINYYQSLIDFRKPLPTYVDLWILHAISAASVAVPFCFVNSLRHFFQIKNRVVQQINNNWWTWYFTPAVVAEYFGMDLATVMTEAFGITAPVVLIMCLAAGVSLPLLYKQMTAATREKQIASYRLANLLGIRHTWDKWHIQFSTLPREQMQGLIYLLEQTDDEDLYALISDFIQMRWVYYR